MSRIAMSAASAASQSASSSASAPIRRIVVVGGNGYVGSHILRELIRRRNDGVNIHIASVSRSGVPPTASAAWCREVEWRKGDALAGPGSLVPAFSSTDAVISCIGGFGNVEQMERINGDANVNAIAAAKSASVSRFVYISAHHYNLTARLQQGYFAGKFKAERALVDQYGAEGVAIRPSFVYGTRQLGGFGLPLWLVGTPLAKLTSYAFVRNLGNLPYVGPIIAPAVVPPVSVEAVARAAVEAVLNEATPPSTVIDVDELLQYEP